MISLVICHRDPILLHQLKKNIEETIGIPFEIIIIDNSETSYTIFQAYNLGIKKCKYDIICFSHEDIILHTKYWGRKVIAHFENPDVGIIGIAGGHFIPDTCPSWAISKVNSINILQSFWKNGTKIINHVKNTEYIKELSANVVSVDGVWFCVRKKLFSSISFDERTFNSFHGYDIDICLQVRKIGYSVLVVSDILIEHFSIGRYNEEWIQSIVHLRNKWKNFLPQIVGVELTQKEIDDRKLFAQEILSLNQEIIKLTNLYKGVINSKAYLLGKLFLKPISFLKSFRNLKYKLF